MFLLSPRSRREKVVEEVIRNKRICLKSSVMGAIGKVTIKISALTSNKLW